MSAYEDAQKAAIDAITDLTAQCAAAVKRAEDAEAGAEDAERDAEEADEERERLSAEIEELEAQIANFEREDAEVRVKRDAEAERLADDYNRAADTLRNFEDTLKPVVYREKLPLWERVETVCTDLTASRKAYADLEAAIVPELERLEKLAALLKDIAAEDFGKVKNARLQALIVDARKELGE